MKVVLVNTYERKGGAAIAAGRLFDALKDENVDVNFLVQNGNNNKVDVIANSFVSEKLSLYRFSRERFKVFRNIKSKQNLYGFDTASFGLDIRKNILVQEADVLHLHWINFGFLSLKNLEQLSELNKPIIWTLHDMWVLTGGCFYSNGCEAYKDQCKDCPFLKEKSSQAEKIFNFKKEIFKKSNFHLAAISSWTKNIIEDSYLFKNKKVIELSNPINSKIFSPVNKIKAKEILGLDENKIHIGFVAFNVNDKRKGAIYLKNSLNLLFKENPELKEKVELIAIGSSKDKEFFDNLPVVFTGYISEVKKMVAFYNACDFMLLPSLEDNLPLVIQEAMACQTPIIAFDTGGISDLVKHNKSGYLAKYKDTEDFANGMYNFITKPTDQIGKNARKFIVDNYSNEVIANKAIEIYKSFLK